MRLDASVFGRSEYLKENMLWIAHRLGQRQRLLEVLLGFPGEANNHIGR